MAKTTMKKGVTESGFEFTIDPKRLENYELIDVMSEVDENPLLMPKILKLLLGKEQTAALVEHCKDEEGIASIERIGTEITDIFASVGAVKNS